MGWRLDYAFVDKEMIGSVIDSKIHPGVEGSDHCPISISLELPFPPIETK